MKNRDKFEQVWKVYYKNSVEGVLDQKTAMLIKEVASAFWQEGYSSVVNKLNKISQDSEVDFSEEFSESDLQLMREFEEHIYEKRDVDSINGVKKS